MKKILSFVSFFSICILAQSQLTGDGTFASPWSGTMSGDATWSGTKYINGDIIVDNEKLTVSAGAIIIFLIESADLKVTGTGQLEAVGTSGNYVRFTSDDDNDGNYGEAGERWGHISFEGSTAVSVIDYCIIEYGVKTGTGLEGYGGGIHINTNDLTLSNSEIRFNKSTYGGGVFVNKNVSPEISNCKIINNQSTSSGGGLYVWSGSSVVMSNCIIYNNQSLAGGGGGGIFLGQSCDGVKLVNCTIVNNNSASEGKNIHFYYNTDLIRPSFLNCIIWNPTNSITYSGQTPSTNDFINCAILNPVSGSTTNCISLNATNNDAAGPNFVATDGTNWMIQLWSPCMDIGNSTDPDVPSLDFAGNPRVGLPDAGAFECQFYVWQGDDPSTPDSWSTAANWKSNSMPPDNSSIYIPSGLSYYPTASSPDFTIGSSNEMIVKPGGKITLGALTNNGTLKLNHDASGFASLILGSYTDNGAEEIQLYLTGGGSEVLEDYKWHYISSPVSSISTDVFTGVTLDLAQFVESRPSTSLMQGWVAFDGYVYSTGTMTGPTFSSLTAGKGYNFWDGDNNTFTFDGALNTSNVVMSLGFSGLPTMHGYNLLGNPFSSGLNWDDIANSVYFTYPASTSKGVYFTRNNVQCTYINGVGNPSDVSGIIPPMQGFFTKTYATGNSITLPAAARTHDNIHARYKGETIIPLVRLSVTETDVSNDETVVRFDEAAKSTLDNDFDAVKMFLSETKTTIHTSLDGTDYAINGLPFPETLVEIPVVVNMTSAGNHKISAIQLQGLDLYNVTLTDNSTGFIADLKSTPDLLFSSTSGLLTDRFILKISNVATAVEKPEASTNSFNIYHGLDMINIQTLADEWDARSGSVRLLDMTGKTVKDISNTEFNRNSLIQLQAPSAGGLYVVEIRSGILRYVGKVIVK